MWWLLASALAGPCETLGLTDLTEIPAPAIIVLGERQGHQPDLRRAERLVAALEQQGDVTLAVEAVESSKQPVLDKFARGEIAAPDLPGLLAWETSWGFDWKPYENLVTAKLMGADVVAIGAPYGPPPPDSMVAMPPRYIEHFRDAMGGHEIPPGQEGRFAQSMAWRDHHMASTALNGWSGEGYLLVLANRTAVEGGLGVGWQLKRATSTTVHTVMLVPGRDPQCTADDRYWK